MRARKADAIDRLDRATGAEQLAELRLDVRGEISTPRVDVLPEKRDLADPVSRQLLDLGENVARPSTLLEATDSGNDAVRADGVAAHRHLNPGLEASLAMLRQVSGEGLVLAEAPSLDSMPARSEPIAEMGNRPGPEGNIDERIELEDPLVLRLGITAAHRHNEVGITPLPGSGITKIGGQLLIGLLPNRACVEDHDVGGRRIVDLAKTERFEHALDPLRVVRVHLTTERGDVVSTHRRPV